MKISLKHKFVLSTALICTLAILLIIEMDRILTPTALILADAEVKATTSNIINKTVLKEYSEKFVYNDVFHYEKDESGNIVLINADTIKMNKIANEVAVLSMKEIDEQGVKGVSVSLGYLLRNNILSGIGPSIKIKMKPIGNITTTYSSSFTSAGINQTNHKIYVIVTTKLKVILPFKNNEITIENQIPILDTIIIGKVPSTAIDFGTIKNK